jgi:acetolactate synthase I/II/III large subunit
MNKPCILIGAGCPQSLADKLCTLGIPVLTTWQGIDRVPENSPVFCGRPGVIGQRAANIIQQKSDLLIVVGARLDMEQVGHRMDNFAPNAVKWIFDIDQAELNKLPASLKWSLYTDDLNSPDFFENFMWGFYSEGLHFSSSEKEEWLQWCKDLYNRFRSELDGASYNGDFVDPYYFMRYLSDACEEGEIIVPGSSGMQSCALMQAFKVKENQKILLCNTTGSMGFEPMAIGAALGTGKRVICVTGDGGFSMNFQELETVKRLNLPIKYFVFCNDGYGSITTMQDQRFGKRVGGDKQSGFTLPSLERITAIWGFPYHLLVDNLDVSKQIRRIIDAPGPAVIRVNTSLEFKYACKVQSSLKDGKFLVDDMSDMSPKLDPKEYAEIMAWGNE